VSFAHIPNHQPIRVSAHQLSTPLIFENIPDLTKQQRHADDHTLREIFEQPKTLENLASYWDKEKPAIHIPIPKHLIIIGCGSSYHSGLLLKHWLQQHAIHCDVFLASEIKNQAVYHSHDSLVIAISQSGETADTLLALQQFDQVPTLGVCNVPYSTLTQLCQHTLLVHAGQEIGVASTKAFTAQVATLYFLYHHFIQQPFAPIEPVIQALQHTLSIAPTLRGYAQKISTFEHVFFLGKHDCLTIALEAALKLKELTYIHAEGVAIGELKHGPLAMVDPKLLLVVLMPSLCENIQASISEIRARQGFTLSIGHTADISLPLPHHPLSILCLNLILQLLAVYTAEIKGVNIDQPRNLAKCVTVE
jgi:glucosamine--fructose-6-phosphate aminotransferase (isomerizing)